VHNFLRGNSKAHASVLNALKLLSTSKINVEAGILITSNNIKELPELIEYLYQLRNITIVLQPLDERIGSQESKNMQANNLLYDFWPDSKDVRVFFKWAIDNNKIIKNTAGNIKAMEEYYLHPGYVLKYRCFSGQRNIIIYPNGDVHLCFKSARIGNLMESGIKQIITSENAIVRRHDIKNCKKYCRVCGSNFYKALKS
jgi:MoaA/NifB/PqqE/SkfB family radical SAM enzyme